MPSTGKPPTTVGKKEYFLRGGLFSRQSESFDSLNQQPIIRRAYDQRFSPRQLQIFRAAQMLRGGRYPKPQIEGLNKLLECLKHHLG